MLGRELDVRAFLLLSARTVFEAKTIYWAVVAFSARAEGSSLLSFGEATGRGRGNEAVAGLLAIGDVANGHLLRD